MHKNNFFKDEINFQAFPFVFSATLSAQLSVAVLDFDGIGISKDEAEPFLVGLVQNSWGCLKGSIRPLKEIK